MTFLEICVWFMTLKVCVASFLVSEYLAFSKVVSNSNKNVIHESISDQVNVKTAKEAFQLG